MLIGLDKAISPDLLHTLARMGHGDEIAIVDLNFPAASIAQGCVVTQPLRIGLPMPQAVAALLRLIPADDFDDAPLLTMQVVGDPSAVPPAVAEMQAMAPGIETATLERHDFLRPHPPRLRHRRRGRGAHLCQCDPAQGRHRRLSLPLACPLSVPTCPRRKGRSFPAAIRCRNLLTLPLALPPCRMTRSRWRRRC